VVALRMGKITSIYLTDEESMKLKKFCNENQCTQYSVLKTALKELLSKPIEETEKNPPTTQKDSETDEATEKNKQIEEKWWQN